MNAPSSRIILEVERAISEARRGMPVIITSAGSRDFVALSSEHYPQHPPCTDAPPAAIQLMKLAGLLPQVVAGQRTTADSLSSVSAEAIAAYPASLAASLEKVSEATVPLPEAVNTRFIAFRPRFGHEEHLAVVVGAPTGHASPLVRLHSSCVTGDIFASLRCDCGSQLHKALRVMAQEGCGIVLYLSQEGRGIGIANKLRAYALQDSGMDTVDANLALGFEADERDFAIAASMLKIMDISTVTLLTNNPLKQQALAEHGITVTARREITTPPTLQNKAYLATKASKMGHTFTLSPCNSD